MKNACAAAINISRDWIPVCPVQHYLMGGIETDIHGRTNITGLYAAGEAAYTGVHGANRLASNSMLECLVFGRRAAEDINRTLGINPSAASAAIPPLPVRQKCELDLKDIRQTIKELMSEYGYVFRTDKGLSYAAGEIGTMLSRLESVYDDSVTYFETLNIATVALAILKAALKRPESIGSHYREDDRV